MDWLQILSTAAGIVVSIVACIGFFIKYLHQDIVTQGQRTDKLYEMFVDLLKDSQRQTTEEKK